jgi:threonyl-tRNA synthetase
VIIHRAILGSVERFTAVLIEHTGGKWPFWLSPRQVAIVPVALKYLDYARKVRDVVAADNYFVDVDESSNTLNKKIREAQLVRLCPTYARLALVSSHPFSPPRRSNTTSSSSWAQTRRQLGR